MVLIVLWPFYSGKQSRSSHSTVVLAAVVVLFPLLFFATYFTQSWPIISGFEQTCPFVSRVLFELYFVKCYFDIFVMGFVPVYRCIISACSARHGPTATNGKGYPIRVANAALVVFYILSFAILWIDLVIFGVSRHRAHELAGHSDSDSENVWSFGQVVSVTGWLPVIIGLLRVWFCKSSRGIYIKTNSVWRRFFLS